MEAKNGRIILKSYLAESSKDINPAILLSGLQKKKKKITYNHNKMLIRMFMASAPAFVRALNCKQHKCPPIVKWTLDYLYRILQNASAIISK